MEMAGKDKVLGAGISLFPACVYKKMNFRVRSKLKITWLKTKAGIFSNHFYYKLNKRYWAKAIKKSNRHFWPKKKRKITIKKTNTSAHKS